MASTWREPTGGRGAVADVLGDASNVLLRASPMELGPRDCLPAIVPGNVAPSSVDLLVVSYTRSADEWFSGYLDTFGEPPGRAAVVEVGGGTRSAAVTSDGDSGRSGPGDDRQFAVETLDIDDLTGLGMAVSDRLASWSDAGGPTVVCFDSLTALLQTGELERIYRFLHVLTARIGTAGAVAYFHFDPDAHDRRTAATVDSLFDATAESDDGDGERTWTVRTGQ